MSVYLHSEVFMKSLEVGDTMEESCRPRSRYFCPDRFKSRRPTNLFASEGLNFFKLYSYDQCEKQII